MAFTVKANVTYSTHRKGQSFGRGFCGFLVNGMDLGRGSPLLSVVWGKAPMFLAFLPKGHGALRGEVSSQ